MSLTLVQMDFRVAFLKGVGCFAVTITSGIYSVDDDDWFWYDADGNATSAPDLIEETWKVAKEVRMAIKQELGIGDQGGSPHGDQAGAGHRRSRRKSAWRSSRSWASAIKEEVRMAIKEEVRMAIKQELGIDADAIPVIIFTDMGPDAGIMEAAQGYSK